MNYPQNKNWIKNIYLYYIIIKINYNNIYLYNIIIKKMKINNNIYLYNIIIKN